MTHHTDQDSSRLSALVDGQLHDFADVWQMAAMDEDEVEILQRWHRYHLIGEVMRSGVAGVEPLNEDFLQKIRCQLPAKTTVSIAHHAELISVAGKKQQKSANDKHWRLIAGVASMALVGVLLWQGLADNGKGENAVLARAPDVTPSVKPVTGVATAEPVMLRNAQLDALLAAHRQFGGASAFQTPAGFLRNATFEVQP